MMWRNKGILISFNIPTVILLFCLQITLLESKSVTLESNNTGPRALLEATDVDTSNDADVYDTQNQTGITKGPPVLTQNNSEIIRVPARENVELKCPVTSEPPPLYDWFKGQDRIDSSWERFELSSSRESNTISIRSVKHEDEGDYTCEAVNGFGKGSFTIHLVVTGDDPFKDNYLKALPANRRNGGNNNNSSGSSTTERPEILKDQLPKEKTITVLKGGNSTLKCQAKGSPRPNITWFKDNVQLGNSKLDVSFLKLINISESDAGMYKCAATNYYGKSTFEITIEVEASTWEERTKAEIVNLTPSNLTLYPGESGSITCLARFENELQPHLFWVKRIDSPRNLDKHPLFYNGSYFEVLNRTDINERSKHLFTSNLILTNVSRADAGSYHCVIAGRMGYSHTEAHVFIETDPAQLLNIQLSKERAVTIQWAVFSCFVFLISTVLILACIYKMYSCHREDKLPNGVTKNRPGRLFPPVSFFRCSNSVSINTPDKSGGDTTLSTTLSNQNPSNENIQPLFPDPSTPISRSSSPELSMTSSMKFRYGEPRRHRHARNVAGSQHSHEHRHHHYHHHKLVKPLSVELIDGVGDYSEMNEASQELHKLYNSSMNQIFCNSDECSECNGTPTPETDFPDFNMKDSVAAYLNRSRQQLSSRSPFLNEPSEVGSVGSSSWSYQEDNLNNNRINDLNDDPDIRNGDDTEYGEGLLPGPKYVYPEHEHGVNTSGCWGKRPEVFHDKNLNSCYFLNKNELPELPDYLRQGERIYKRKRRAPVQQKSRYHQPPSSPVSFYSNAPIIV